MAHVVVKNLAGEDMIAPAFFREAPSGEMLRKKVFDAGSCVAGSRFKLLHGTHVVQNAELLKGGSADVPLILTLVFLPGAGASEEALPCILPERAECRLSVQMLDIRTGSDVELPFRYFLGRDGEAYLGVLAVELAPMIGANVVEVARLASMQAMFEDEASPVATVDGGSIGGHLWKVIGGADRGGIIVREGSNLESLKLSDRLSFGAMVRELVVEEGRLHYRLISGTGPTSGWVSVSLRQKDLLVRVGNPAFEIFRSVIQLSNLPQAISCASTAWTRRGFFVDIAQKISTRLDTVSAEYV